jgi:hypothetical protein
MLHERPAVTSEASRLSTGGLAEREFADCNTFATVGGRPRVPMRNMTAGTAMQAAIKTTALVIETAGEPDSAARVRATSEPTTIA